MANTITTKYGTVINVKGLTPEQIKKVMSVAQDNGAYGSKGAALASSLQKQAAKAPAPAKSTPVTTMPVNDDGSNPGLKGDKPGTPQAPITPTAGTPTNLGVNPHTGTIDPNAISAITGAGAEDTSKNFQMQNPGSQTDALGNTQNITIDPNTGQTSITKNAGGGLSAVNQAFTNSALDFGANGKSAATQAADANYNYITQHYSDQKQQEMASAKQELANRGIPLDPSPNSLYGRTLASIDQKYQSMDDQAHNQAITQGNQTLSTQAGVVNSLGNSVAAQNPTFTAFQGGQANQATQLQQLLSTMSAADQAKYIADMNNKTNMAAINKRSGGGGGGGGNAPAPETDIVGGNSPGFGV